MEFHYLTVGIHHSLYILTYASAKDNLYKGLHLCKPICIPFTINSSIAFSSYMKE